MFLYWTAVSREEVLIKEQDEARKAKRIKKVKPDGARGYFFIGLKLPCKF
jgi:hypothetical protein